MLLSCFRKRISDSAVVAFPFVVFRYDNIRALQGRRHLSWPDPRAAGAAEERGGRVDISGGVIVVIVINAAADGQNVERQRQEEVLALQGGTGYVA